MIRVGHIHTVFRARWAVSFLLFTLLCVTSACANPPSGLHDRLGEHDEVSRHDTRNGSDHERERTTDTKIAIENAATPQPTVNHLYHRHGTGPDMLRARGVTANSSTTTISNPAALSCYSTYSQWRAESMSWAMTAIGTKTWPTTISTSTITQTVDTVATIYPSVSLSTYKLCDGSPRVDFEPLTLTSQVTSVSEFDVHVTVGLPTYSATKPCKPSPEECEYLYYHSGLSWDDITLMALCGSPTHLGLPCLIMGGPVQLAYFPVTIVGSDKCQNNGSTITNTEGPTAVEALGTTLTSGSVYLSFKSLYAFQEGFGERIGPAFTDFILPLPSSAISTQCGGWFSAQGSGTALNYADLNFPWPASAYNCMNRCRTDLSFTISNGTGVRWTPPPQCSTIWSDLNPILAMPTEVRNLVPAWSTCSMWDAALPNFVFDPPRALVAGTTVATPTPAWMYQDSTASASPAATSYTALPETLASTSTSPSSSTTTSSAGQSADQSSTASSPIASVVATPTRGIGATGISIEFDVDGHTFTASAGDNAFSISGQTISVGGPARVVGSETISLALSGFVVNATTTIPFTSTRPSTTSSGTAIPLRQSQTAGKGTTSSGGSSLAMSWAGISLMSLLAMVFL
ncbi:uncharacterized protein M437DRAFT_48435 [Aureobasidium melanogenum CBS 110374]|uniref:Uncharacterized protein n=1 Tax=Aureobasidium melanogenum (strain CBS 110374) TaxID=1043003 RepID=A0A074VQ00_AURM1|nr:uncharacterized protein M437DRAFT_48435 [Aureobasidium melanogenum CBS 110374]KEQ62830.1 hypothetical protein M437DRAFT_48435 [Aureobasidium melanogenum CBS 110374]